MTGHHLLTQETASRHDVDVEEQALSCCLLRPTFLLDSGISDRHFFQEAHKRILRAWRTKGVSMQAMAEALYGDVAWAMRIAEASLAWEGMTQHLEYLESLAEIRDASMTARSLLEGLDRADTSEARKLIEVATGDLAKAVKGKSRSRTNGRNAGDVMRTLSGGIIETSLRGIHVRRSELTVIAAEPGTGKTTLSQQFQLEFTQESDELNINFSMEMPAKAIYEKVGQRITGRRTDQIDARGELNPYYEKVVGMVEDWFSKQPGEYVVEDMGSATVAQLRSRALEIQAETGRKIKSIVIDQFDKLVPARFSESEFITSKSITVELNNLAKELDCAVILLIQLGRRKSGEDGYYTIKDIFGTSGPEQDAGNVMLLQKIPDTEYDPATGLTRCRLMVAKRRSGGAGGAVFIDLHGPGSMFREAF